MNINELINEVKKHQDCEVFKPNGLPQIRDIHILPKDLVEFYEKCGGMELFKSKDYSLKIVPPEKFILANPVIVGELCEYDISSDWYIIAQDKNNDYITIDLNKERLGKCYDSFWDCHGVPEACDIVANSFTELIEFLISSKGKYIYWNEEDFAYIGDAYDGVEE